MSKKFSRLLGCVLLSAAVPLALSVAPAMSAEAANFRVFIPDVRDNMTKEFSGTPNLDGWTMWGGVSGVKQTGPVVYTPDAITIEDDALVIRTRRHCVDTVNLDDEPLTNDNASTKPCPDGKITRYSTGRVYTPWLKGGEFDMQITANMIGPDAEDTVTLEDGTEYPLRQGSRPAIWMQNGQLSCPTKNASDYYGELDLVEYYGHYPANVNHSAVHWGCGEGKKPRYKQVRQYRADESLANAWHTWGVNTTNKRIQFTVDGKHIDTISGKPSPDFSAESMTRSKALNEEEFHMVLHQPWRLILENRVETAGWAKPPADDQPFTDRFLKIKKIQLTYASGSQSTPRTTTTTKTEVSTTTTTKTEVSTTTTTVMPTVDSPTKTPAVTPAVTTPASTTAPATTTVTADRDSSSPVIVTVVNQPAPANNSKEPTALPGPSAGDVAAVSAAGAAAVTSSAASVLISVLSLLGVLLALLPTALQAASGTAGPLPVLHR